MVARLFGLFLASLWLVLTPLAVGATDSFDYESFADSLSDILPDEIGEALPEGFWSTEGASGAVEEMSGFSYLLRTVGSLMGFRFSDALRMLAQLLGLLVLVALLRAAAAAFPDAASSALSLCSTLSVAGVALSWQWSFLETVELFAERLNALIAAMNPALCTLYALGGNVRGAVVNHGAMVLLFNACQLFCTSTVRAFCAVCTALALVSAVGGVNLKSLGNALRKLYSLSFGFVMLLVGFALGSGQVVAQRADTLAARSAKFLTGAAIPVVGGSVGDSLRALGGGVDVLRATVGIGGVILVLLLVLPTLLSLLLARFSLILATSAAEILGCERESKLLGELGGLYGYLIAAVSIASVGLLFALLLFVRISAALGG